MWPPSRYGPAGGKGLFILRGAYLHGAGLPTPCSLADALPVACCCSCLVDLSFQGIMWPWCVGLQQARAEMLSSNVASHLLLPRAGRLPTQLLLTPRSWTRRPDSCPPRANPSIRPATCTLRREDFWEMGRNGSLQTTSASGKISKAQA